MTDILSDILETVAFKAALYFRTEFYPPFGIAVPAFRRVARFHLIVGGECFVRLESGTVVAAQPGDLIFVPNGTTHVLASNRDQKCQPLADVVEEVGFTGPGPFVIGAGPQDDSCQMICGHFDFADEADHPLLRTVPEILHITAAARASYPLLDDVLRLIVRRAFADQVGAAASISRLSEVLLIEVIRASLGQGETGHPLMAAISDPHIGPALSMVHGDIAARWTIQDLAGAVGMSRSRFAERFHDLVGASPMAYVAEWRMQRALRHLSDGKTPVKVVAAAVGFSSAAAFSRAFSGRFGRTPREQRLRSQAD